eukprot:scaffold117829_cov12-Tisochrysis_lutea.AAC.1
MQRRVAFPACQFANLASIGEMNEQDRAGQFKQQHVDGQVWPSQGATPSLPSVNTDDTSTSPPEMIYGHFLLKLSPSLRAGGAKFGGASQPKQVPDMSHKPNECLGHDN